MMTRSSSARWGIVLLALLASVDLVGQDNRSRRSPDTPVSGVAKPRIPGDTAAPGSPANPEAPVNPEVPVTPLPEPPLPGKRVLTPADFTYLGFYDIQTNAEDSTYGQGLTHRYVNGDFRLLTLQLTGDLHEVSLAGRSFGDLISTTTNTWALGPSGALNNFNGFWWEEAKSRLWVTSAVDYTTQTVPVQISTLTLGATRTVSNVRGPIGLSGLNAKRVYGGAQPVPTWFQTAFNVGPYVVGWGGYTSLMAQGGGASLGPTMYAIPDPAGYGTSGTIPTSAYRVLMDSASGTRADDWYRQGSPTSFDRGIRMTNPVNYFDGGDARQNPPTPPPAPPLAGAQWLSPAPDGRGRFVWGDSYYNTGVWIDGPTTHGFLMVASLCGGRCWYQSSTLAYDRRVFELHIWDPARLGDAIRGARPAWNIKPTSLAQLNLPLGNSVVWGGNSPTGNIGGATFDPVTRRLYMIGFGVGADVHRSRIFVFQVAE